MVGDIMVFVLCMFLVSRDNAGGLAAGQNTAWAGIGTVCTGDTISRGPPVVPMLVMDQSVQIRPGDAMLSINVLLSLILAWILYSNIGQSAGEVQTGSLEADLGQAY